MRFRQFPVLLFVSLSVTLFFAACSDFGSADDGTQSDDTDDTVAIAGETGDDDAVTEDDDEAGDIGAADTVDLGIVLSLSGPNAAYGDPSNRGIELALADFEAGLGPEGVTFSSNVLDDEGDAALGAEQFEEQIQHGVDVILGPTLSNTAFEAHPVAQQNGVPVLAISNTAAGITETGDFIFRVSLAEDGVVPQTVEVLSGAWQPGTAALVYSEDDAWSRSSADAFRNSVEAHGIEIVTEQDVSSEGGDFTDQIAAVDEAGPDVILISALEHPSIEFVNQAREFGLEQDIACGNGCNTGTFIEETGEASQGVLVGSAWHIDVENEQSSEFVKRYRELHDQDPDQFSAQAYAGMQILAEAASQADSTSPETLREALAGLDEVDTVLGPFSFDESRDGTHPAVVKMVQGEDFVIFGK
jgi:branched-chain amino acid transport system substrate-binding protein